ncbi:MAG: sigma-54-dependent Fis family transcriptional regulator [Myxococcales bacterium]|nr:sigma-54-dependent Fis family transcriptional regulator [Myxococcales bacterium]
MHCATILVVDDEPLVQMALRQRLEQAGHQVLDALDLASAAQRLCDGIDLVLLDQHLPDGEGLSLLSRIRVELPDVPVVMMTASNSVDVAVSAMSAGAFHYVTKPFDRDEMMLHVARALETRRLRREIGLLRAEQARGLDHLVGRSSEMLALKQLLHKVARSPASTVLISGESGTGKGLVARALHEASDRRERPFVSINCSALPPTLIESELFGHERGAFTDAHERKLGLLEAAQGGTLFLDEVGELALPLQAKLLGFLEERTYRRVGGTADLRSDVRVIAATNADLADAVQRKAFREDLYYRLAVMLVNLPPLRQREGDAELLALHYVARFNDEFNKRVTDIAPEARRMIEAYHWPGNIRELRNTVERAMLLGDEALLSPRDFPLLPPLSEPLPEAPTRHASERPTSPPPGELGEQSTEPDAATTADVRAAAASQLASSLEAEPLLAEGSLSRPWRDVRGDVLERAERVYLVSLLRETRGRVGATAERAGIQARSLFDKMKALGLRKEDFRHGGDGD